MKKRTRNRKNRNRPCPSLVRRRVPKRTSSNAFAVKSATSRMLAGRCTCCTCSPSIRTRPSCGSSVGFVRSDSPPRRRPNSTRRCICRATRRWCIRATIVIKSELKSQYLLAVLFRLGFRADGN
uniref:(northern house mosquito) hypothetical protein n=1 Tax=Culex pipiens TaxID=7175 RepID=A0A8D8KE48_CULPI